MTRGNILSMDNSYNTRTTMEFGSRRRHRETNNMRREKMVETRDMHQPTYAREEVQQERAPRIVNEEPHR